jgi:hypothetical protein
MDNSGKVKNLKLYDLDHQLIGEFSSYKDLSQFIGVGNTVIANAIRRNHRVSKKYYIKRIGNINGKIDNICNTCGVNLCDKNKYFVKGILKSIWTCKHCMSKTKACKYTYEDPKFEKIAQANTGLKSSTIYYVRNKRTVTGTFKKYADYEKGICRKCGVPLSTKNQAFSNNTLLTTICKQCRNNNHKMCMVTYKDPDLEKLSKIMNAKIRRKFVIKSAIYHRMYLVDWYVRYLLTIDPQLNLTSKEVTSEMIILKRKEVKLKRLVKWLK